MNEEGIETLWMRFEVERRDLKFLTVHLNYIIFENK